MAARVKPLWKVSLETSPEAEDAVIELLGRIFGAPAAVYADTETRQTIASVYVPAVTAARRKQLAEGLARIGGSGLNIGPGTLTVRRIRREDWAESWKRHFKPLEVSARLLVKPSWSKLKPKRGQALVVLDPGLSFGTGQHPTTGFCLEQVAGLRREGERQSLLDAGCGSGILAISAVKLGYQPVDAFDFDPEAVRVAKENAARNAVAPRISRRDLTKLPVAGARRYDVICANLTYDLLIAERDKLLGRLATGGTIVLAGILLEQFGAVQAAFQKAGLKIVAERSEGEWRSAAFRRE